MSMLDSLFGTIRTVYNNATELAARPQLRLIGGIAANDNAANSRTDVYLRTYKVTDLATTPGAYNGQDVRCECYTSRGDGGGGNFVWSTSSHTADGYLIIAATGGYWLRQYSGAVNVKWFGAVGDGSTNNTSAIQAASTAAKSASGELYFPGTTGTNYIFANVDVAGLRVTFGQGVTVKPPVGNSTQWVFRTAGTVGSRVTQPTYIGPVACVGNSIAKGFAWFEYCDDVTVEGLNSSGFSTDVGPYSVPINIVECIRPKVKGCTIVGGRVGIGFESCTNPTAEGNVGSSFGRDGILFYTNPSGTTTTNAISIGNRISAFAINGEEGRAGVHFYGTRGGSSTGDVVSDDSGNPTNDGTAGIRFRDCEDFSAVNYKVTNCRVGLVVNNIGDYAGAPHSIITRGAIGAGSVDNYRKYGIATTVDGNVSITGAQISNSADALSVSGIYTSSIGSITGCVIRDTPRFAIRCSGKTTVTGNTFLRCGRGSAAIASVYVDAHASIVGNYFLDDVGTPIATLAIRLGAGTAKIGTNSYGVGVSTPMQLDAGATVEKGSLLVYPYGGVPTFGATIGVGSTCFNSGGVPYCYYTGAWNAM